MNAVGRTTLLLMAGLYLGGCQGDEVQASDETISMRIALTGDVCGVVSATASVAGADMAPIGPVALTVADATIQGRITSVPAGTGRKVLVTAYNASKLEVYSGATAVDVLAGKVASARLVLNRNTQNCTGTNTGDIDVTGVLETGDKPTDGGVRTDGGEPTDGGKPTDGREPTDGGVVTDGGIRK